nr:MAG: flippase-like domain-containing protein [Hyphomicrobiales bacterium]
MSGPAPAAFQPMKRVWKLLPRVLLSAGLLIIVFQFVDTGALVERIDDADLVWVAIALLATLPQYFLSAARWRLTAGRLGAHLPFGFALSEYYLAVLTNQILPGGVLGDAARAFRHGRRLTARDSAGNYSPAVRAVVFERVSGQLVLFLFMLLGLFFWPGGGDGEGDGDGGMPRLENVGFAFFILLIAVIFIIFTIKIALRKLRWGFAAKTILADLRHALLARDVVFLQALYSLGVLATYLFCFYCAGRAIGITMSVPEVVALVPAILFSMTIPITIAGWGIREASAASIFELAHLAPVDGVAISVAYGIIVLLSAVPGIFFVIPRSTKSDIGDKR